MHPTCTLNAPFKEAGPDWVRRRRHRQWLTIVADGVVPGGVSTGLVSEEVLASDAKEAGVSGGVRSLMFAVPSTTHCTGICHAMWGGVFFKETGYSHWRYRHAIHHI